MTKLAIATANRLTLPSDGDFTIWYFGTSFTTWRALPAAHLAPMGSALCTAAERWRESLRNLDAVLDDPTDRLSFDSSAIGARGRYDSELFLNICRWSALRDGLRQGGTHVVVVDDPDLGYAIAKLAAAHGPRLELPPHPSGWKQMLRHMAGGIVRHMRQRAILSRLRKTTPLNAEGLGEADVLLVIWGRANSFPAAASHDNWFGRLPGDLMAQGKTLAFVVVPVDWVDDFEAIAANALNSGYPVIFPQECATGLEALADGLAAQRKIFSAQCHLGDLPIGPLLDLAVAHDRRSWAAAAARLRARVVDGLAQLPRVPPVMVYVYEGQPWEKALLHRVRSLMPDTKMVAIQHMPCPKLYLNFFPSDLEIAAGSLPDHLLCIGDHAKASFLAAGYPADRLSTGGALRFENIHGAASEAGETPTILCCVGVDLDECRELVWKVATALADHLSVQLIINFNPLADQVIKDAAKDAAKDALGERVSFSEQRAAALIPNCTMVIYADTNAAYEAFAAGCHMVHVTSDFGLEYDKLPDGWAVRCREVAEIAQAIGQWLAQGAGPVDPATRRHLVDACLAPAGESQTFLPILSSPAD